MKRFTIKKRQNILSNIRRTILFLSLGILLTSAVIFYFVSRNLLLKRTYETDVKVLEQSKTASTVMQDLAYSISAQVYSDYSISYLMYGKEYDAISLRRSFMQLDNYRQSISFLESIYVYNSTTNSISVSSQTRGAYDVRLDDPEKPFFDAEIAELIKDTGTKYKRYQAIPRKVILETVAGPDIEYYFSFVRCGAMPNQPLDDAVIVNFSDSWLRQITEESIGNGSETLILSATGKVISHNQIFDMFTDVSSQPFFRMLGQHEKGTGNFIEYVNGERMLISFIETDANDWHYVRMTPYRYVVGEINEVASLIFWMVLALAVIGIGVSLIASQRLYIPIGKANASIRQLEDENRQISVLSKQHALRNFLLGTYGLRELSEKPYASDLAIPLDENLRYYILLLQIRNYPEFCGTYSVEDQNLMRYAVMNIATEILGHSFPNEAVTMGGDGNIMAVILAMDEPKDLLSREDWHQLIEEVQWTVQDVLSISLSSLISRPCNGVSALPALYRQTSDTLFHQIFYPNGTILFADDILSYSRKYYVYPTDREELLVDAIIHSNLQLSHELIREIIMGCREYSYSAVNLTVSKLTFAISNVVEEIRKTRFFDFTDGDVENVLSSISLNHRESIEEIITPLCNAADRIILSLEDKRNSKYEDILRRIDALIEQNYSDFSCGLENIADQVGLSPAYVGRLYRRYTLKSITESIGEVRMRNARRMLRDCPKMTIAEIAEKCGYSSNSYFSKAFRKDNGMTPNEYRSSNLSNGGASDS